MRNTVNLHSSEGKQERVAEGRARSSQWHCGFDLFKSGGGILGHYDYTYILKVCCAFTSKISEYFANPFDLKMMLVQGHTERL